MLRPAFESLAAAHTPGERLDRGALESNSQPGKCHATDRGPRPVYPGVQIVVPDATELDLLTCPAWRDDLLVALERADCRVLVVDLSRVEFFGASGLGVLVDVRDRAAQCGAELRLVICSRPVWRPLEVTGLVETFVVYGNRVDALTGDQEQRC